MAELQRRLMTRAEVAELLGLTERTLRRWAASGVGPDCFHVGREIRYRTEAVTRWVDQQETTARRGAA